jgi:hypothetical protein
LTGGSDDSGADAAALTAWPDAHGWRAADGVSPKMAGVMILAMTTSHLFRCL